MYKEKVSANEFRNFYLTSRSEQLGHDIATQNADLGAERLAFMRRVNAEHESDARNWDIAGR